MSQGQIIVTYSPQQQKTLDDDVLNIHNISGRIDALYPQIDSVKYDISHGQLMLQKCRNDYDPNDISQVSTTNDCLKKVQLGLDLANGHLNVLQLQLDTENNNLAIARKNYNDDLSSIQSQINLQTQAAIATTTAATQAYQNQITLNQNSTALLADKARIENETKIKALNLQLELDKKRQADNLKIGMFVVLSILVLTIGSFIIKKLL